MKRRLPELGQLPVLIALSLIWVVFGYYQENFLSARNLTNLSLQIAAMGVLSVAVVLVLLIGEMDLSIGVSSGLSAAVMAVLLVEHGTSAEAAIAVALLAGAAGGGFHGFWVTRFGVPSFVVTLAGLLALQGLLLQVLGRTGAINLFDPTIVALTGTFLSLEQSLALAAVSALTLGARDYWTRKRRSTLALPLRKRSSQLRAPLVFLGLAGVTLLFQQNRGVPLALVLLLGLICVVQWLLSETKFGREILAVGGNTEAARRAGIRVERVKILVFSLAGAISALGGVLAASRLQAVNQSSGGGDVLLSAIAAAVIGGTSLFGGRGSAWSALTGSLVIGSIANGMDLLALPSSIKFMVTGLALLVAVTLDAVAKRR